jgi:hypothetical protein
MLRAEHFPAWSVMTCWRIRSGRSSAIIWLLSAIILLFLRPRPVAAQALEAKSASTDARDVPPSAVSKKDTMPPARQDLTRASLPDAPQPTGQAQEEAQNSATPSGQQPNQLLDLPPTLTRTRLSGEDKLQIYMHKAFGPPALILPAFGVSTKQIPAEILSRLATSLRLQPEVSWAWASFRRLQRCNARGTANGQRIPADRYREHSDRV